MRPPDNPCLPGVDRAPGGARRPIKSAAPRAKVFAHNERKKSSVTDTLNRRPGLEDWLQYEGLKRSNLTLSSRIQSSWDPIGADRIRFSERKTSLRRRLCVPDFFVSLFVQRFRRQENKNNSISNHIFWLHGGKRKLSITISNKISDWRFWVIFAFRLVTEKSKMALISNLSFRKIRLLVKAEIIWRQWSRSSLCSQLCYEKRDTFNRRVTINRILFLIRVFDPSQWRRQSGYFQENSGLKRSCHFLIWSISDQTSEKTPGVTEISNQFRGVPKICINGGSLTLYSL